MKLNFLFITTVLGLSGLSDGRTCSLIQRKSSTPGSITIISSTVVEPVSFPSALLPEARPKKRDDTYKKDGVPIDWNRLVAPPPPPPQKPNTPPPQKPNTPLPQKPTTPPPPQKPNTPPPASPQKPNAPPSRPAPPARPVRRETEKFKKAQAAAGGSRLDEGRWHSFRRETPGGIQAGPINTCHWSLLAGYVAVNRQQPGAVEYDFVGEVYELFWEVKGDKKMSKDFRSKWEGKKLDYPLTRYFGEITKPQFKNFDALEKVGKYEWVLFFWESRANFVVAGKVLIEKKPEYKLLTDNCQSYAQALWDEVK